MDNVVNFPRIRKQISTEKILREFMAERHLWLSNSTVDASGIGAMGAFLARILQGELVTDRRHGIPINLPIGCLMKW